MIKLAQEQIADVAGFNPVAAIAALDRCIGAQLQLPEGEIAKLPAHVQQTLPDIQRQRDTLYREFATVFQLCMNIASFERRAKILPVSRKLAGGNGHTGGRFDLAQNGRTPAIEMR